jgi:hypothetical protein
MSQTPLSKRLARRGTPQYRTPPSVVRRKQIARKLAAQRRAQPGNITYCVKYTRPKRQWRESTARKYGEYTTTGIHTSRCFDDIDQSISWLAKLQDSGKCDRFCAIYERFKDKERMFWPRAAKRWKSMY